MSIFSRMMTIDRRIIYIILALAIVFPMFMPIGLPVASEAPAVAMYDYAAALPAGTPVLHSADFSASGLTELKPMVEVLIDLSLEKGHKLLLMSLWADGNNLMNKWVEPILAKHEAVYGEDYIDLGYIPSYAAFLDAARTDFKAACNGGVDKNRNSLDSYPIMEGISVSKDIKCVISYGTGDPGYTHWIQYWYAMGEVDAVMGGQVAVNYPNALNAYNAGNLKGVAGGLGGAATLEKCHNIVGPGHGASDSQSFGHLAIILFLILGNVGYFGARNAGEVK